MFSRIKNLFVGFFSLFIKDLEAANPEIAYENAINSTTEKYIKARNAVSGIVAERTRTETRVNKLTAELAQVNDDLDASLNTEDDDLSAILIQKKEQLEKQLSDQKEQLKQAAQQVDAAKTDLLALQAKIDELKRERDSNLARFHSANARKQLQDQLSGLSTENEIKALDNVRQAIDKSVASVQLNEEMAGTDIDKRLATLRQTSGQASAKSKVAALKEARKQSAQQGNAGKSM